MTVFKYSSFETENDWLLALDNAGDSGGPNNKPSGVSLFIPGPTAAVYANPNYEYETFYRYRSVKEFTGRLASIIALGLNIKFEFPTAQDIANCQALEFEIHAGISGYDYDMAWQAGLVGTKQWNTFDYPASIANPNAPNLWVPSGIAVAPFIPGLPVALAAIFQCNPNEITHVGLCIDGKYTPVNFVRSPTKMLTVVPDFMNFAFQLDCISGNPPPAFRVDISGMGVSLLTSS
jgi:hypothetical protein